MPVLTPRHNLTEAQQAVQDHFEVVTLTDIAQGNDAHEKKGMLTFLHGRRSGEPVRFKLVCWKPATGYRGAACTNFSNHVIETPLSFDVEHGTAMK